MRRVLAPLRSGTTLRRGVHLILGGVVLLPYVLLGATEYQMLTDPTLPRAITVLVAVLTAVIGAVPALLDATRILEIAAARLLLDVDLPVPPTAPRQPHDPRTAGETRLRGALWFAVHLLTGGAVGVVVLTAAPLALVTLLTHAGPLVPALEAVGLADLGTVRAVTLTAVGLAMLVGIAYAVAALGALAALMAPTLLGPSPDERIAVLEAQARRLAERNRLARELHDSVGHALTLTVLQAGAAGQVLDSDPAFVRRALTAIEESGRAAMDDLDRVLGVLRDEGQASATTARTLLDLPRLLAEVTATERPVDLTTRGELALVPAALSREGYRLVQEALTNALRHAPNSPVTVTVTTGGGHLTIEVVNPLPAPSGDGDGPGARSGTGSRVGSGVGLAGMRERMTLLGGLVTAGPDHGRWRVRAELPL